MGVNVREKIKGSGVWWIFIKHKGRRRSKKVGRDRKKAVEAAKKIEARLALGDFGILEEPQKILTFEEYAETWSTVTVPSTCKESTEADYKSILTNHVLPTFRKMPINEIKKADIKTFLMKKYNAGVSKSTVKHIKSVVSGVLNLAVEDETILINPAQRMGKLFHKDEVHNLIDPLTRDEIKQLLKTFREKFPEHYGLCLLLARTGMRIGEAMALKWDDIDFNQRIITVRRSLNRSGKGGIPKSAKARRVDMSGQLKSVLQDLRLQRKVEKLKRGWKKVPEWVFVNGQGNPLDKDNWRDRVFYKSLESAKIRKVRVHDLRHTYASLLIQAGESLAYIRDQMGHHSIQVTVDIYGHLVPGGNRDAVDRLDDEDYVHTQSAPYPHPNTKGVTTHEL